ncbi:hypothetical protein COCSADRAFT_34234 [Bipolaris sorokiniana ND90Pr]|uniref:Uncharacterized protein n=1 Tax=Cochliobolus sativus (strain ND90Pr / ATCC 201652) TaxID=665912 RepID=M2TDV4_COCSN|nr:uncharacterized protein COCSADRAFT_34234 [Bipolaris sorokiniana ND90Pr]EMD67421.1 hypothetical protein COCSADRAFT_34234 [Bipolaris sorokiniana ND90Pr]
MTFHIPPLLLSTLSHSFSLSKPFHNLSSPQPILQRTHPTEHTCTRETATHLPPFLASSLVLTPRVSLGSRQASPATSTNNEITTI